MQRFVDSPSWLASPERRSKRKERRKARREGQIVCREHKQAFAVAQSCRSGYFGLEHAKALVSVLSAASLHGLVEELINDINANLCALSAYVARCVALQLLLPHSLPLCFVAAAMCRQC